MSPSIKFISEDSLDPLEEPPRYNTRRSTRSSMAAAIPETASSSSSKSVINIKEPEEANLSLSTESYPRSLALRRSTRNRSSSPSSAGNSTTFSHTPTTESSVTTPQPTSSLTLRSAPRARSLLSPLSASSRLEVAIPAKPRLRQTQGLRGCSKPPSTDVDDIFNWSDTETKAKGPIVILESENEAPLMKSRAKKRMADADVHDDRSRKRGRQDVAVTALIEPEFDDGQPESSSAPDQRDLHHIYQQDMAESLDHIVSEALNINPTESEVLSESYSDTTYDFHHDSEENEVPFNPDILDPEAITASVQELASARRGYRDHQPAATRATIRRKLETNHPQLITMWMDLEDMALIKPQMAPQPLGISRQLKPFQREGLHWMREMEMLKWKGGLLGDEMGLGKTIQAVSLIMSDFPAGKPSLVLVPPVALMQWVEEVKKYTDGKLKTFVFHKSRAEVRRVTVDDLKKYDVIMMSYNSLESLYRREKQNSTVDTSKNSPIHESDFHRVILDEAHEIKTRSTSTAKACFALKANYRWCLSGTPLQNRIGEFFSLLRFINIEPFSSYFCRECSCESLEWTMDSKRTCTQCPHNAMCHVSVFNQELLNPIQKNPRGPEGIEAFRKMRLLTDRIMLRRQKKDHMDAMELPVKEVRISREFFGEVEKDFADSIMNNGLRKFDTYVARRVLLNNYANIFGLIMQMRQVADHPDLILRKESEGADGVLECSVCESPAEDAIMSRCKHHFCRSCASGLVTNDDAATCPRCHIGLVIDLEQPEMAQAVSSMKKSSIVSRIRSENWTSSTKIEMLLHELYMLRSDKETIKVIIFSQFTSMLQLVDWRLRHAGFTTVVLDGSMTPDQRAKSITEFMTNVDVECFLVSLRAGGVALNLTEASRVFLIEPWWNPAVEWQSADRCHRIGQCRPCTITNLVIEDSVESRMVMLQEKKARMIRSTINNDTKAMESLTPEDMMFLFRGS